MNLKRMETFITLMETQSFSLTAKKLGMSQPAVSQQLKLLESEVGTTLLQRDQFSLTRAGQIMYDRGKKVLKDLDSLEAEVKLAEEKVSGLVKIGASTVPITHLLPSFLKHVSETYSDLFYHIQTGGTMSIIDLVSKGTCDVGFVGTEEVPETLASLPIYNDRLVLIAPPQWDKDTDIKTICQMPFVSREKNSATRKEMESLLTKENIKDLKPVATVQDSGAVLAFVENGLGFSVMSYLSVHKAVEDKRVQVIHEFTPSRKFSFIYRKKQANDPVIKALENICRNFRKNRS
ncbi:LysR family transcriptional regulator [Salipaludibacillus keqinensis]|nr:LysR family transcriptional regulator [Salipaludibacillus keqinensis]